MIRPKVNLGHPLSRLSANHGPRHLIDNAPVRDHILKLHASGMNDQMIARAAGTSIQPVGRIRRQQTTTVTRAVAQAICSVDLHAHRQQALVLNIGCRRRIEALHAMGHSAPMIGARIGFGRSIIVRWRTAERIYLETLETISAVYDDLWNVDGGSLRTKNWAARNNWLPPLAWDNIDDPYERPTTQHTPDTGIDEVLVQRIIDGRHKGRVLGAERDAVVDHAISRGWDHDRLALSLNISPDGAGQALVRRRRELRKEAA